jgi:hypothetical protein
MELLGRKREQAALTNYLHSGKPEFVAVYGRRRVGKTFLIRQFFRNGFCFYLTGKAKAPLAEQLQEFNEATAEYSPRHHKRARNWSEAFRTLREVIEASPTTGRKVVFIDEMPWLATDKSGFMPAIEHFWNGWGSTREDLMLIVCGSATSWMIDHLINDTGGLHNRITGSIYLQPFCLGECEQYFAAAGIGMNRYQMIESYMVFGGIPYYMSLMQPQLGFTQNVDTLCFSEGGVLRNEFTNLYASLFKQPENHLAVVRALSSKGIGLTRSEIEAEAGLSNGGRLTKTLDDLLYSGFVRKYKSIGKAKRDAVYQLIDPFTLFHLRFMADQTETDRAFWSHFSATSGHSSWSGYAFERVALMHIEQVKQALGIGGVLVDYAAWRGEAGGKKAQIDLLIDRYDSVINLCEMKYCREEFAVDKDYDERLRDKLSVFRQSVKTKKNPLLTLVTTYGLARNSYSSAFQSVVTADDLFVIL